MHIISRNDHPKQPYKRPDTRGAYSRMLSDRAQKYIDGDEDIVASLAFAGVRCFNQLNIELAGWEAALFMRDTISRFLAKLTPEQFVTTFPPEKTYDGEKYQCKDYFSTMKAVNALPPDEPIGDDNLDEFLWNYMNHETMIFVVKEISIADAFRKEQGQPSVASSFFADQGITPRYLQKGPDGKQYLYDPETDSKTRVFPKRPFKIISRNKK